MTGCQRNPFQTSWNIFSEDDLWYLIVYPQAHASGNTPVRSRFPFWPVNRKDVTRGDHGTLDLEETARGDGKISRYFMGFTGFYIGRMFSWFFFRARWSWTEGLKRWLVRASQDCRRLWSLWGRASCTSTSIQQHWRMGWLGKLRKLIFFWCASSKGEVWMLKDAKLRDTDEILFKVSYIPGFCPTVASWSIRQRHTKPTWCFIWETLLSEWS